MPQIGSDTMDLHAVEACDKRHTPAGTVHALVAVAFALREVATAIYSLNRKVL